MRFELHNDFHNTYATVIAEPGKPLSRRQMKRLERELCMSDCLCSGIGGIRGPQSCRVETVYLDGDYTLELYPETDDK